MEDQGDMISVITTLTKKKTKSPKSHNEVCVGMSKKAKLFNFQFSHLRQGNFIELFILPFSPPLLSPNARAQKLQQ